MKKSNLQTLNIVAMALFLSIAVIVVMPVTAAGAAVIRDLPDAVSPGEEFEVSLTQSGFYMNICGVTETLPDGFKYRGVLSGGNFREYDETTNELTIDFEAGTTTLIYRVEAGTKEQIETAEFSGFSGTWASINSSGDPIYGDIGGEATLEFVEPTPTPTEAPPSGNGVSDGGNGGGGGGGIPLAPPAETPAYIHLTATPADIPADATSTSTITASVWDGDKWVMENLTVNFSADSGDITASAAIVNGTATGILTAGTEEGIANVTAEANLSGDIGVLNATTTVNFTTPGVTPTPTATPEVTATETPTAAETPIAAETPAGRWGIPGFEGIFAIAGLLAVAYLVLMRRRRR